MFSALRQRLYDYISPSRSRDVTSSRRGREQSPLRATRAGRVAKADITKLHKQKRTLLDHISKTAPFNSSDDEETDSDGDTVSIKTENTAFTSVSPTPRKKTAPKTPKAIKPIEDADDTNDTDDDLRGSHAPKLTRTEETEHIFDIEAEGSVRRKELTLEEHPDWSQTEIDLFNKLNMRGFEPLLPKTWQMDFKTVPEGLFSLKDEAVFINSISGKDFRASRALSNLLTLGVRVRDRLINHLSPEPVLARAIAAYIKWSHEDANLNIRNPISVLAVATAGKEEPVADVVNRLQEELFELGALYRDEFRVVPSVVGENGKANLKREEQQEDEVEDEKEDFKYPLPTLYGLVVAHTVVALVTYDSAVEGKPLRNLALFDFGDCEQDVWNAFAVAMIVIWARNYLVTLPWKESQEEGEEDDPDA